MIQISNWHLSAFLQSRGVKPANIFQKPNSMTVYFSFPDTAEVREMKEQFFNDIPLQNFVSTLKIVKRQIHDTRENKRRIHHHGKELIP